MTTRTPQGSSSGSPIVKLAGVGIVMLALHALWNANGMVLGRIAALPVQGKAAEAPVAAPAAGAPAPETPSLAPLLIESRARALQSSAPVLSQSAETFSTLFDTKPEPTAKDPAKDAAKVASGALPASPELPPALPTMPVPASVDHFAELAAVLRLDAVAPDGAVVNGTFYPLGAELTGYAYPDKAGKSVAPKLLSAQGREALVAEPGGKRRLRLKLSLTN